jgi:hypothetical protein
MVKNPLSTQLAEDKQLRHLSHVNGRVIGSHPDRHDMRRPCAPVSTPFDEEKPIHSLDSLTGSPC